MKDYLAERDEESNHKEEYSAEGTRRATPRRPAVPKARRTTPRKITAARVKEDYYATEGCKDVHDGPQRRQGDESKGGQQHRW